MPLVRLHKWIFTCNDIALVDERTIYKEAITRLLENAQSGKYTYRMHPGKAFDKQAQMEQDCERYLGYILPFCKKMMDSVVSDVTNCKGRVSKSYLKKLM